MYWYVLYIIATGLVHCNSNVSCEFGYYSKNGECYKNECICSNGTAPTGWACPKNLCEKCMKCDNGFHTVRSSVSVRSKTGKCGGSEQVEDQTR